MAYTGGDIAPPLQNAREILTHYDDGHLWINPIEVKNLNQIERKKVPLWRRVAILLVLVIVLIVANAFYSPAVSWRGVLSGEAGELLYAAAFDGFTDEWQEYEGRTSAAITDGKLVMSAEGAFDQVVYSATKPYFADLDVSANATWVRGNENNAFGIVYRLQEPTNDCRLPLQVLCDVSAINNQLEGWTNFLFGADEQTTGYAMFLISSDGYYSVWRGTADGTQKISTWIQRTDLINGDEGAVNRLRVIGQDGAYRYFINGTQVELCIPNADDGISTYFSGECIDGSMQAVFRDDTFETGQVALVIDTVNSSETFTIEFDDFIVTQPDSVNSTGQGT